MTDKIQNAGTEVVEAKAGTGSATLSMVSSYIMLCYVASLFIMSHCMALRHVYITLRYITFFYIKGGAITQHDHYCLSSI